MRMPPGDRSRHRLLEAARIAVVPMGIGAYVDAETGTLPAIVIDESWGMVLMNALRTDVDGEPCLALGYNDLQGFQDALRDVFEATHGSAVLLTSSTLRKHVAQLAKQIDDKRYVLAVEEIPVGTVTIDKLAVVERSNA